MDLLSFTNRAVNDIRERYRRRRTLSILENLPPHVRKDIGWPHPEDYGHNTRGC